MDENSVPDDKIQKELAYYRKQLDQMSGETIRHDFVLSSLRHELKQKKEALSILTKLQKEFSVSTDLDTIFDETVKAVNAQLNMDYSMILVPSSSDNLFKAGHWNGFPDEQKPALETGEVKISPAICNPGRYILRNKTTTLDDTNMRIQTIFPVIYFAGVPVLLDEKPIGFIISGRNLEKIPFVPPVDKGDADTLTAIAGLISTVIQNKNMMELRLQKAEVEKQNEAIAAQRDKLELTLNELKNTQAQLVQREKMASLGELTAGIAHEIQNPLNFVNNFSDVNIELISEMHNEIEKGNYEEVKNIASYIETNAEKINHHGKRAEAIVKGMLQHSRLSGGQKEPTDLNALADEYLRLAYHGLRAKNKSFSATIKTEFDDRIGKIDVIPQDIGRVILNLINNAFYAVNEKQNASLINSAFHGYEPTVAVSSKKTNGVIQISVTDNGNGVSQKILDKIFQPFFTTKPTGQGTGLGLSLSYDIIKAHNGEIKVVSKEGEGTEFIVQLPA